MKALLTVLLLLVAAPAVAAEKGDLAIFSIICRGPQIVSAVADAAEKSLMDAREILQAAVKGGMCFTGQFTAILEEKTREGVDATGMGYQLWTVSDGDATAYTFVIIGPSV